ncbi:MAG: SDR family NAD(P)-dependent oxidoreductase [Chloroflexi bacterium]|nr:SDR family NAD(P)-dependent oxidoreductase [Chloroflexota bacterium]
MTGPAAAPRVALVTGATSGIGRATAELLVARGWRVVGTGRRADRLAAMERDLGGSFRGLAFDIADEPAMRAALVSLPADLAAIDLLVNGAGLGRGTEPAQEGSLDDWRVMVETNVMGLLAITRELLPGLIERRGAIVNLSSVHASWPAPANGVYGGTKAFVRQFSLDLRVDLHGTGVRVTSIEPGLVETDFFRVRSGADQAGHDAYYGGTDPLRPEDVAEAIAWVAGLPPHVNVDTLEIMPVSQSWAGYRLDRRRRGGR